MENRLTGPSLLRGAIDGVSTAELPTHRDDRGTLSVIGRVGWPWLNAAQWNLSRSAPNVLRGLHAHKVHSDWLVCVSGELIVGLIDLRPSSPTFGRRDVMTLQPLWGVFIPVGVGHGFYSRTETIHVYATSTEWSHDDEFGCRFDDPDLCIDWGLEQEPTLSERDQTAGSFAALLDEFADEATAPHGWSDGPTTLVP